MKKVTPKSLDETLFGSVPYDAIRRTEAVKNIGHSTGLCGTTHRYRTLGHDPVLGWIFGPINIISDSLTKSDFITTYAVRNNYILGLYPSGTLGAFYDSFYRIKRNPLILPGAVAKQAIHYGADYFTKQSLPIPFMGTLNPDVAKTMVMKYSINMDNITRGMALTSLVNLLIVCIRRLFYDGSISEELYEVKTKGHNIL